MSLKLIISVLCSLSFISLSAVAQTIITSPNDTRLYKSIELPNKLPVLLISDPTTDSAAVSLNVEIGSASDPLNRPGLAHFLEHMLFLGTEKYPQANAYANFISSNGGSQNAFTARDNTNYFFDVNPAALPDALDRFAQFFIAPLFSPEYVQRERQAVHSEYQSKLKDDAQRNYHALKQLINPLHPERKFFIGSQQSLADTPANTVQEDLLTFYQKYYSANRMSLVILGKEPLLKLEALAIEHFSAIKNLQVKQPQITVHKFTQQQLPVILKVKSIKDIRLLSLSFATPATQALDRLKPLQYIGSLLGDEGEGSLTAYLKGQGYINALSTSSYRESALESSFQTRISLTEKGYENIDDVIGSFFSFVHLIKKNGIRRSLYAQERQLAAQAFQFLAMANPANYVVNLSQVMREYPAEHWLNAGFMMGEFKAQQIEPFLAAITPQNMLLNIQAQSLATDRVEPFFGTQYGIQKIKKSQLLRWQQPKTIDALWVRHSNPFIATDMSLLDSQLAQQQDMTPQIYNISPGVRLWHLQDTEFLTPKATFFFNLTLAAKQLTLIEKTSLNLYGQLLRDHFNQTIYDAGSAGLYLQLYPTRRGISIKISGFSDRQVQLIAQLNGLSEIEFNPLRFDILKHNMQRALANSLTQKPYHQLISGLMESLTAAASIDQKQQVLEQLTLADVDKIKHKLFNSAELRILSHGNITAKTARQQAQNLASVLTVKSFTPVADNYKILKLLPEHPLQIIKQIDSSDSALIVYFQAAGNSNALRASTDLITEILANEYSNELRTEQQLGYLVFASSMNLYETPGLVLVVQSPDATLAQVRSSNDAFLSTIKQRLTTLSAAEFSQYKNSLISKYQRKDRSIYQRSSRFWQVINTAHENFAEQQALINATHNLDRLDIVRDFKLLLTRRIELHSFTGANTTAIASQ
ncbi:MAG: insulinase family protein [Oceanospirillaceae bacterium]|nr:insulinase family protein [Oceanospirillaceae bacterium]